MGGRQSVPRAPDKLNETSRPFRPPRSNGFNVRTLTAPLAAFTMAGLLFVYTRTSIRAAKLNAQKHREADGGQISWKNESRRRHGQAEKVEDSSLLKEALLGSESADAGGKNKAATSSEPSAEKEALDRVKVDRRN